MSSRKLTTAISTSLTNKKTADVCTVQASAFSILFLLLLYKRELVYQLGIKLLNCN